MSDKSSGDLDWDQIKKIILEDEVLTKLGLNKHLTILNFLMGLPGIKNLTFARESGVKMVENMMMGKIQSFCSSILMGIIGGALSRNIEKIKRTSFGGKCTNIYEKIKENSLFQTMMKMKGTIIGTFIDSYISGKIDDIIWKIISKLSCGIIDDICKKSITRIIQTQLGKIIGNIFVKYISFYCGGVFGWIIAKIATMILGIVIGWIFNKIISCIFPS